MTWILGIDTSAYTTSIALIDEVNNEILADERKLLEVKEGQKGLRQQEAVFQHLKNLPELYSRIGQDMSKVGIVSVSSRPRNEEGSYMPVFVVGRNFGRVISHTINCDFVEYSHQENHIAASIIDNYKNIHEFLAVHISGGTTEFVAAKKISKGFETKIAGGTKDITFGQLIDRLGIRMEFPFPCGRHMEEYIKGKTYGEILKAKTSKDPYINLSGIENYYVKLLNKNTKEEIIASLFEYIAECIINIINSLSHLGFKTIIISGGVASNSHIRNIILKNTSDYDIIFPAVGNSSDNALGLAFLPIIDRWHNEVKNN